MQRAQEINVEPLYPEDDEAGTASDSETKSPRTRRAPSPWPAFLKLCPLGEEDALQILARLAERKVIELRQS